MLYTKKYFGTKQNFRLGDVTFLTVGCTYLLEVQVIHFGALKAELVDRKLVNEDTAGGFFRKVRSTQCALL